jgi:Domain of unknown function DUF11/FG-GAP-like repeat/Putative binding domain, N-terminal
MSLRLRGRVFRLCVCFLSLLSSVAAAPAQTLRLPGGPPRGSCAQANPAATVRVHAPEHGGPYLNFCDGRPLGSNDSLTAGYKPSSLASGDFDEDGVPDLVTGYSTGSAGVLTVHHGNVAALWPYGDAARSGAPTPFLSDARTFALPEAPDFLAAGDFDADGHFDLVAARRGGNALWFLRGDGRGGFHPAQRIPLAGSVTALVSGEINRADGLPDLVIGVNAPGGPQVLVYESPEGAVKALPEVFKMGAPVTALALGHFDGTGMLDLAIAAGDQLIVVHGRDRKLSLDSAARASVAPARVSVQRLGFKVNAIVSGDFAGAGPSIAALGDDGRIHILEHALAPGSLLTRMLDDPSFAPTLQVRGKDRNGEPASSGTQIAPSLATRLNALRQEPRAGADRPEWTERNSISLPPGFSQSAPRLMAARVTGSMEDDILLPDAGNNRLHVFSTVTAARRSGLPGSGRAVTNPQMRLLDSLESEAAPVAVLPMRLGKSGLQGMVVLEEGSEPIPLQQNIPPANIFTVTNTSDAVIVNGITKTGPAGSLRKAMADVQNASSTNGGGQYEIDFDIPTTDPGYNAATGTFLIQPLSENVPGSLDNFALPPINATVTIDGYTQPGASPNTLATSDNAKILIRIDGAAATTPGGSGFVPFDDVNSTFRGFDFTRWTNPLIANGTASGAMGIEANGVGDYIEGNFFGTDPTGTLAKDPTTSATYGNRIGVFADNGPGFGNMGGGTILGGTTPQARNILSNNQTGGALFLATAYEAHLEGNFIGLDASGAKALANTDDGVGANGPTVTLGGTLPGDGNVISANGTDIDFNDITNGGQASDSIAQGNLVGTDATGTINISQGVGSGASITSGPTDETIGGTTPAARNVLSGNYYGVYIVNATTNNVIQGNFIGTDVTGTRALGNLQQGLLQGATGSNSVPATNSVIGGEAAGAGNLISGNMLDGISISGTVLGGTYGSTPQGSTIEGNLIGTDITGTQPLPNGGTGISLLAAASNNSVGGTDPGAGNTIAYNTGHGVLIDSASGGNGNGNNTVGNTITGNGGAGVRINSGAQNRISQNSIYQNKSLGIDLGTAGPNANTNCNSTNTGANNSQNYPVLTAGTGTAFFTATATDPNGNTSEFSQAVASSSGNMLDLMGNFNSLPNTTYTIEFFSSPTADPSGYGQGQTYLGSTQVTTGSNCTIAVSNPLNPDDADMSVTLSNSNYQLQIGPDFGTEVYSASVRNLGPAAASNVVLTDVLPSSLEVSSLYCDLGPCQPPVTTSFGSCTVQQQTVTCNLGAMAVGQTAEVNIPVQVLAPGSITNTATVSATQTDPNLNNNSSSVTKTSAYPEPFIDVEGSSSAPNIVPDSALAGSAALPMTIYGIDFLPSSSVSFNGTALPTVSFVDNQLCSQFQTYYCAGIKVVVPASLLTTAGTATISVSNPDPGPSGSNVPSTASFTIASSCTFTPFSLFPASPQTIENDGTTLIAENVEVGANVPTCSWTASSSVPWVVPLESTTQSGLDASIDFAVAPNSGASPRSGSVTVAGQEFDFTQDAGSSCDYTLGSTSANFPAAGGPGSVAVTPNNSSCAPFVVPFATWITVPQSSSLLLNNSPATFTVAANTGAPRTGNVMIGGYVFTVNQSAPPCYYTLSPGTALWGAGGGSGSIAVTASSSTCAWTATPSNASLVSITSGASGTGNGTVQYTVAANTNGPQAPTITVSDTNGGSSVFSITQASDYSCTFSLSPSTVNVAADGTSNFFEVTASNSFCNWTAASSDPSALTVTVKSSGQGVGAVYYAVGQNTSSQPRTLTITAGCETFTVNQDGTGISNNPVPAITTLQPASATAGSGAFTLTVNGSGFISGSVVNFGGSARTTTYVSATQLTAAILATDVASAGTPSVTVTNPAPGGGTSNAVTFTISAANNPLPAITTLQPASATAGSGAFTLTVNGSGFISGSVVNFGGSARTTTYVSATQLTAAILATDVASAGTPSVTVTNPAPGGGTSNAITFTVSAALVPSFALSSATGPQTVQPAGSAKYTITVTAQNGSYTNPVSFSASSLPTGATASFQPSSVTPGSSSATTQLTIQLPSALGASFGGRSGWAFGASMLSLVALFVTTRRTRRRWIRLAMFALACLGGAAAVTGCNGGFFAGSQTTPQNYTVTITGASGAIQQTTTVQLTVE